MEPWFTVENIDCDTFAISEYQHWEENHCYLLCGKTSALLIDTGLGVSNIKSVVDTLTTLPVMAVTTHAHWDHIGGHKYFNQIAVHEAELDWLTGQFPLPLQVVKQQLLSQPCDFPADFVPEQYEIFQGEPQHVLRDGDQLDLGGRVVQVIHTPGHSPGHCCFYEEQRGYLYSGDLIYRGTLDAFYPTTDPVQFWKSIQRVQALHIGRILPGHHALDVPLELTGRIEAAFRGVSEAGKLWQGSGSFDYGVFQIHI